MRNGSAILLVFAVTVTGVVLMPSIVAYNNGYGSADLEYDCGGSGSCHVADSTCIVTMAASNSTPEPEGVVTVWVNVSGGQASGSPLGVMIVSATTTSNSMPSADGWTILSDPSGSTTYNYYEIPSYESSVSMSWELSAPSALGVHLLYARVMHGNGGMYAEDSDGLMFTVTDYSSVNGDDDGVAANIPILVITSPSNAATVSGNITINANVVSVDEIESATLMIDRVVVSELTSSPFSWMVDTTNMTEGGHVLKVTVTDSTGDTVSEEITVFVDNESELVSMLEWLVTMGAGTMIIISFSSILMVLALYIRKRVMDGRRK